MRKNPLILFLLVSAFLLISSGLASASAQLTLTGLGNVKDIYGSVAQKLTVGLKAADGPPSGVSGIDGYHLNASDLCFQYTMEGAESGEFNSCKPSAKAAPLNFVIFGSASSSGSSMEGVTLVYNMIANGHMFNYNMLKSLTVYGSGAESGYKASTYEKGGDIYFLPARVVGPAALETSDSAWLINQSYISLTDQIIIEGIKDSPKADASAMKNWQIWYNGEKIYSSKERGLSAPRTYQHMYVATGGAKILYPWYSSSFQIGYMTSGAAANKIELLFTAKGAKVYNQNNTCPSVKPTSFGKSPVIRQWPMYSSATAPADLWYLYGAPGCAAKGKNYYYGVGPVGGPDFSSTVDAFASTGPTTRDRLVAHNVPVTLVFKGETDQGYHFAIPLTVMGGFPVSKKAAGTNKNLCNIGGKRVKYCVIHDK